MKGLSVVFTILLLLIADGLPQRLRRAGALPAEPRPEPGFNGTNMALAPTNLARPEDYDPEADWIE